MTATMIASGKNIERGMLGALAAFAIYAASLNFTATPTMALPSFDGLWSVLIVTEKGDCDRGYRYPIRITRGTLSNGGVTAFTMMLYWASSLPSDFVSAIRPAFEAE